MRNSKQDHDDQFSMNDFEREAVPGTDSLQMSILERARLTPQQISSGQTSGSKATVRSLFSWLKPLPSSAALACLALIAVVGVLTINFDGSDMAPDTFSENDLEWQELMLIEDDLLFAQI